MHLSYQPFLVPDGQDDVIKQSIMQDVVTLKSYSSTWPLANAMLGQVRGIAHTLFNSKRAMSIYLWGNLTQDDTIRIEIEKGQSEPVETYARFLAQ